VERAGEEPGGRGCRARRTHGRRSALAERGLRDGRGIETIADDTAAYGKPVLYLDGDSHVYRSDNPLQRGSTCYTEGGACSADAWNQHPFYDVPNFHRIVVHGSTFPLEWLELSIDPRAHRRTGRPPTRGAHSAGSEKIQEQLTPAT
jgi:hypothetical protein